VNNNPTRYTDPDGHEPADSRHPEIKLSDDEVKVLAQTMNADSNGAGQKSSKPDPKVVQEGRSKPKLVDVRYRVPGQRFDELLEFGRENPNLAIDRSSPAGEIAFYGQRQARGYRGPYQGSDGYIDEFGFSHQTFCMSCHADNDVARLRYGAGAASTEWARFDADVALTLSPLAELGIGKLATSAESTAVRVSSMGLDDVGPRFDLARLERIKASLSKEGVTFWQDDASEKLLKAESAAGGYIQKEVGKPGQIILMKDPSRSAVTEELYHLGQQRKAGFPKTDIPRLVEMEMQAQVELHRRGVAWGWTPQELKGFTNNWVFWQDLGRGGGLGDEAVDALSARYPQPHAPGTR